MAKEFTHANRAYFNDMASNYDTKPWQQKVSANMIKYIQANLDFIGVDWATHESSDKQVRLLDYASGTGTVSRALGPYVTQTLGIDIAPAMVARYNELARASNIPPSIAHAIIGDLFSDDPSELPQPSPTDEITEADLFNFDIVAVGAGFHHFHDQELAIARMAERLKSGGVVLIIDWARDGETGVHHGHDGKPFPGQHTVKTHGFSEGRMKELFESQGLTDIGYKVMDEPVVLEMDPTRPREVKVFLGRARKP